jgi:hypothetical protein
VVGSDNESLSTKKGGEFPQLLNDYQLRRRFFVL